MLIEADAILTQGR